MHCCYVQFLQICLFHCFVESLHVPRSPLEMLLRPSSRLLIQPLRDLPQCQLTQSVGRRLGRTFATKTPIRAKLAHQQPSDGRLHDVDDVSKLSARDVGQSPQSCSSPQHTYLNQVAKFLRPNALSVSSHPSVCWRQTATPKIPVQRRSQTYGVSASGPPPAHTFSAV